jgi:transcriptional regulator GlxA family with amidase domain
LLLAKAGLLDGLEAMTHQGAIDLLREVATKTTVHADRRFVDNARVVCSAGVAAGICSAGAFKVHEVISWGRSCEE